MEIVIAAFALIFMFLLNVLLTVATISCIYDEWKTYFDKSSIMYYKTSGSSLFSRLFSVILTLCLCFCTYMIWYVPLHAVLHR